MVGLLLCGLVGTLLGRRFKLQFEDVLLMLISMGVCLIIGGHLLYGITNIERIARLISMISKISFGTFIRVLGACFGGMVFYGGLLGSLLGILIYAKITKHDKMQLLDITAVCIPLFHVFGRLGCFFGGCCYGKEYAHGIVFPHNKFVPELAGVPRIPVQLIESACNLIIFAVILTLFIKQIGQRKLIYIYLIVYPVVRFVMEFMRGDEVRGFLLGLSTSQWISIILFAFSVISLIRLYIKGKRAGIQPDTLQNT